MCADLKSSQTTFSFHRSSSFLKSISEAAEEIESILKDLGFFDILLAKIQETYKLHGPDNVTNEVLKKCKKSMDALTEIVDSLALGIASPISIKRKWAGVEAVFKKEKILKVKTNLQEAKLDLIAAQIVSLEQVHFSHFRSTY